MEERRATQEGERDTRKGGGGEAKGKRAQNPICRLHPGNRYARDHVKTTPLKSDGRSLSRKIRLDAEREDDRRSTATMMGHPPEDLWSAAKISRKSKGEKRGKGERKQGRRMGERAPADRAGWWLARLHRVIDTVMVSAVSASTSYNTLFRHRLYRRRSTRSTRF